MAAPSYTEEEILFRRRARRRLVGAIVLVVAVIALVPMILPENKPQQEAQQIDIRIPAQDASGYTSTILPAPTSAPADESALPVSEAPAATDTPESTTPAPPVAAVPAPHAVTAAPTEAPKSEPLAKVTYFVQYGAFSEQKNAKQRQSELKAKGIATFTEVVKTSAGDKIRVRSGPYAERDQAESIRDKVKPIDSKLVVIGKS